MAINTGICNCHLLMSLRFRFSVFVLHIHTGKLSFICFSGNGKTNRWRIKIRKSTNSERVWANFRHKCKLNLNWRFNTLITLYWLFQCKNLAVYLICLLLVNNLPLLDLLIVITSIYKFVHLYVTIYFRKIILLFNLKKILIATA